MLEGQRSYSPKQLCWP